MLGRGLERGFYYPWSLKAVFAENTIFIVFSAKHNFADMKECNLKKQKFTKNWGLFAKMQKGVFWHVFWFFGGLVFCFSVFLCFCFVKKGPKGYFPAILEFFFVPPTGLSLQSFFSSYSVFFSFCFPMQNSIVFFSFLSINLFIGKHYYFCFFLFFFLLPFPLLMFACFIETDFPNIPFLKPNLLSFLAVSLSSVVFVFVFMVYVSWCMFHGVCFCLSVSMLFWFW